MEDSTLLAELSSLERLGWDSLCDGTGADFYGSLMTNDGVMVLAHGMVLDRRAVVESLGDAPPWQRYELSDVRLVELGADAAALVYRARADREGQQQPFVALMSSVYLRTGSEWKLALYQQTVVPATD
jgi:hypothetical protein